MRQASEFIFSDYQIESDTRTVHFKYIICFDDERHTLTERWQLPDKLAINFADPLVMKVLDAIHIAAGISYFKTFLPISITTHRELTTVEAGFWNTVYANGLREFCFVNELTRDLAQFAASDQTDEQVGVDTESRAVLGIGGGKDSIVAAELLRQQGVTVDGFALDTGDNSGQIDDVSVALGVDTHHIKRYLDQNLFVLEKEFDGLKGHIPISVLFSLTGLLLAVCTKSRYVCVGNEASASIPNLEWNSHAVNHQWSKSIEYERLFDRFIKSVITPDISYFSPIRHLSSVNITRMFSSFPQYFESFTSCNYVLRIDPSRHPSGRWCQRCDKCLSSFILFAAWLSEDQVIEIFGANLLDDVDLSGNLLALLGVSGHKPLNCVGTPEELQASFVAARRRGLFSNAALMQLPELAQINQILTLDDFLKPYPDHAIPGELQNLIS